jgi:ketosteroid isomerase-like protein
MSEENVEILRNIFDAFNRGDLQAILDLLAPEFEFRTSGLFMDTESVYRGREGYSEFWHTFRAAWENLTISVERIEDHLGEQVLVLGIFHGRGHGSGVEVTRESAWLTTLRDGLLAQMQTFASWTAALEAAGLSE